MVCHVNCRFQQRRDSQLHQPAQSARARHPTQLGASMSARTPKFQISVPDVVASQNSSRNIWADPTRTAVFLKTKITNIIDERPYCKRWTWPSRGPVRLLCTVPPVFLFRFFRTGSQDSAKSRADSSKALSLGLISFIQGNPAPNSILRNTKPLSATCRDLPCH